MTESSQVINSEISNQGTPEIESELKLLRDQVDLLQISTSERKRPWYKTISVIISISAISLSIFTFAYTQIGQRAEEIRSKKKELRETAAALIDLRHHSQALFTSNKDPQVREYEAILLNNKRLILLEAADILVTQIPDNVSAAEYGVLAFEHQNDSNFMQAERYYKDAINAGRTDVTKIFSIRSLATFYFTPGPYQDFGKGRKYFGNALKVVKNPTSPYLIYTLGFTYETWGMNELWNGFQMEGDQKIERARKYYSDLPDSQFKKQALDLLDKKAWQVVHPNSVGQPTSLEQGN